MLSTVKKTALGLLVLISVVILLISSLVASHSGSRWLVERIAQLTHTQLGRIEGNLLTGLDIASVDYANNLTSLHAENIALRWQPLALFYTAISMQSFSAQNIRIKFSANKQPNPEVFSWPSLAQPLRIELANLQLRNIHIQQGDRQFLLNNISGSFSLGTFHLRIKNALVDSAQWQTQTNGSIELRYPYALDLTSEWQLTTTKAENLLFKGVMDIGGDIKKIHVKQQLQQPFLFASSASIAPNLQDKIHQPYADIHSEWPEQVVPKIVLDSLIDQTQYPFLTQLLTTQGHLQLQGWFHQYQLQGVIQTTTASAELAAEIKLQGSQSLEKNATQSRQVWQLETLRINSQSKVVDNNTPEKSFLQLSGRLSWSQALAWDLQMQAEHLNTAYIFAEWPSDLRVDLASKGELKNPQDITLSNWNLVISQMNIQGDLRGLNLTSKGNISIEGNQWQSSDFTVALGANQLALKGKAGNDLALEWKIDAPLLNQIDPQLSGSIISSGLLSGDLTQPNLSMRANIKQLRWRDYAVDKLNVDLHPNANSHYTLALHAEQLRWQAQTITQLDLSGDGNLAQHSISANVRNPAYGSLQFVLDGGWQDQQWRGQWRQLSLDINKVPRWYLSSSDALQADQQQVNLGNLCVTSATHRTVETQSLLNQNRLAQSHLLRDLLKKSNQQLLQKSDLDAQQVPRLCMAGTWHSDSGFAARLNVSALPLQHARAWLKSDVSIQGVADAELSLQTNTNNDISGVWQLHTRDAKLLYQFQGGNTETYALQQATVTGTLKNNQISSALLMDWGQYGQMNADGQYSLRDKRIDANIHLALSDMAPLESFVPALDDVQGSAKADIHLVGDVHHPDINGSLLVENGSANLPKLGLELQQLSVQILSQAAGVIHMDAQLVSGEGQLKLKGDFTNIGAENWHGQGNIFGANVRIIQQPELTATISPNLTFSADAGAINLNGTTEIPWARAAIKTLSSSAIRVSDDVIIVESNPSVSPLRSVKNTIPFYTDVVLYFGEDVGFKGFGLDGQLSGKIRVVKEQNRQALTTGFVAINKGVYKAYGQELNIARGRLIFQGPYDNPGLDIRALRSIATANVGETITAGLDLAGTLQNPKSTVFTIPSSFGDTDAMALLLTGKKRDDLSVGDAYTLITAISNMGVEKGSMMTADITHFFRLDEITIKKSNKGVEQNELWIGKYITPKLFIRYVVGLFDQAFTLGLGYQLNDKLRLEAESGKNQSVDVMYKIER